MSGLPHLRDVSNWQGPVDWRTERREVVGCYVKVSQGLTYTDPTAARRIRNATYAGLFKMGGYHFATPGVGTPEQQADRLLALAPLAPGRLRPCLDAEWNGLHLNPSQLAAWFLGFVLRVKQRAGYWPTVYGSPSYLTPWAVYHPAVFGRCPLWLADYGLTHPPTPPAPWTHWSAWQWTSTFKDPAAGRVDDSYVADLGALTVPAASTAKAVSLWARKVLP